MKSIYAILAVGILIMSSSSCKDTKCDAYMGVYEQELEQYDAIRIAPENIENTEE